MKAIAPAHLSRQYGLSLIGLLIGLLISVLCILGSLTLYKNLIKVATESKLDSNHDGQLASAMLVMQLEVQSAGYGIEGAGFDHIIEHTPQTGKVELLWRFSPDGGGTFECRGFREEEEVTNDAKFRVLKLMKVNSGCTASATLSSLTWSPVTVLGQWRVVDDGIADAGLDYYIDNKKTLFDFELNADFCNPYGASVSATEKHGVLTVTAPGSAFLQGAASMTANKYQFCLPNIYQAP